MVTDLTGLDIANASLLDEGTAAAEAMTMAKRAQKRGQSGNVFFVSERCHPQTIEVVRTRAEPLGYRSGCRRPSQLCIWRARPSACCCNIRTPTAMSSDFDASSASTPMPPARWSWSATDLLALTLLTPPGEFGADIAVGNSQRFGVPLGFGGPHAAFMATRDELQAQMPGRLVGVSVDAAGQPGPAPFAADARAAYPPREGDQQHLHRAGAAGGHGLHVRRLPRPGRTAPIAARIHLLAGDPAHAAGRTRLHGQRRPRSSTR